MKHRVIISVSLAVLCLTGSIPAQEKQAAESKTKEQTPPGAAGSLNDYVGRYGQKEICVRDGGLYYQRIGGRGGLLRPIGKDKFALS